MFQTSRELFEAAREASRDALRISDELDTLEDRATRTGSPSLEVRGRSGVPHDRMAGRVANLIDRTEALEKRLNEDYRLIDSACSILYGADGVSDGLASIAPPWWADAIYHHFLALRTWEQTAALVCYSPRRVYECVRTAFELMDAYGMAATVGGGGMAED